MSENTNTATVGGQQPQHEHTGPGDPLAEVYARPTVSVSTSARALGVSRTTAYAQIADGTFPCRVIRIGRAVRVPSAELLRLLGLDR